LIIQENEEYLIENKELIQAGNIIIKDKAKLTIKNSTLILKQSYGHQYNIFVRDYAFIYAENSKIDSDFIFALQIGYGGGIVGPEPPLIGSENPRGYFKKLEIEVTAPIRVMKGGELEVWDSNISHIRGGYSGSLVRVENSTIGDLRFFSDSDIFINNSTIITLWPCLSGNTIAELTDLKPKFYDYWYLGEVTNAKYNFSLINTQVNGWCPYLGDKSYITFADCELDLIVLSFFGGTPIISDLKNGQFYNYWNLREFCGPFTDYNVILKNTSIKKWMIEFNETVKAKITDSKINVIFHYQFGTTNIGNSEIDQLYYLDNSGGILKDSKIIQIIKFGRIASVPYDGELNIDNSVIYNRFEAEFANLSLTGNIVFKDVEITRWYESKVNRQFKVYIHNSVKVPNIDLQVLNPDGKEIWSGYSDAKGEAYFYVIFTDENYYKNFILRSSSLGDKINFNVISTTPLIIPPNKPPILQEIGNKTAYPGKELKFKIIASDPENCLLTYNASPLPQGASIDSSIGEFSWIPSYSQIGVHKITFSVTDGIDEVYEEVDIKVLPQYTLSVASAAGGTTNPAPGNYNYDTGTEVTITALPDTNYRFGDWTGDVPSNHEKDNPITIKMDSNKSILANFIRQYKLSIGSGSGGTTDPAPGIYTYDTGKLVTIKAVPNSGYKFAGWGGDASGTSNLTTITMDSDKSIKANFSAISEEKKGPCFIATAAYSSPLHPHVRILRDFRDIYLTPNKLGRIFVNFYYKNSPSLADFIVKHKTLKIAVRISLLPLVVFSYSMIHFGHVITVIMRCFIILVTFFVFFLRRKLRREEASGHRDTVTEIKNKVLSLIRFSLNRRKGL
jgi:uncharacterized repeat protein (TIGR02543 family)